MKTRVIRRTYIDGKLRSSRLEERTVYGNEHDGFYVRTMGNKKRIIKERGKLVYRVDCHTIPMFLLKMR